MGTCRLAIRTAVRARIVVSAQASSTPPASAIADETAER
jgi:hypothetical protein